MKRIIATLLFVTILVAAACASGDTWYVVTPNGKTLNLRSETDNTIIGHIPVGTPVHPDDEKSTEISAYVTYKDVSGYVKWTYLSRKDPNAKATAVPEATTAPETTVVMSDSTSNTVATSSVNYSAFTLADNTITLENEVVLRWAPETTALAMETIPAGTTVEILASDNTWVQILDTENHMCGFAMINGEKTTVSSEPVTTTVAAAVPTPALVSKVLCEKCGKWYTEGDEFNNHTCVQ